MDYKTRNYKELKREIRTRNEALKLSNVIMEPSVVIDRCNDLMNLFAELYIESNESLETLRSDIKDRPSTVTSLFYSIWAQISDVAEMLKECQDFDPKKQTLEC